MVMPSYLAQWNIYDNINFNQNIIDIKSTMQFYMKHSYCLLNATNVRKFEYGIYFVHRCIQAFRNVMLSQIERK